MNYFVCGKAAARKWDPYNKPTERLFGFQVALPNNRKSLRGDLFSILRCSNYSTDLKTV